MKNQKKYDVVVIGSGIGGTTPAVLLAQYFKKKVLIIEKHWKFGGLTHGFELDGKTFSPGVHYIGSVNNGSVPDKVFDIITGGKIRWLPMPYRYDSFHFPNYSYAFPSDPDLLIKELSDIFPEEEKSIRRFIKDSQKAFRFMALYTSLRSFAPKIIQKLIPVFRLFLGFNPNSSLTQYLDKRFKRQELKNLFSAQWLDHGVRPNEASFMVHSMIFHHYLNGAFYPENGPQSLNEGIESCLRGLGVEIMLKSEVTQVLTDDNKAYGVKVRDGDGQITEILAEHIISDAGALNTYKNLLSHHDFPFLMEQDRYLSPKYNFFNIYVSLKDSPDTLGFDGANQWIFRTKTTDQNSLPPSHPLFPEMYCVTFPSLKSKDWVNHKVEIMTMIDFEYFDEWKDEDWKKRNHSYYNLKEKIASSIFRDIEKRYPGFMELVEVYDTSTPLTLEKFLSREKGASYGIPFSVHRMKMAWLSNRTPIKNLFLSGQDSLGPGVMGAMMGGVSAAAKVLGPLGYFKVMKYVTKHQTREKTTYFSTKVKAVIPETSNSSTIVFEKAKHISNNYQPGQFILINAIINGKNVKRSYSLSSSPDDEFPSITIKRITDGLMSNFLLDGLNEGNILQTSSPKGQFFIPRQDKGKDIVLIAGGSGITPIYSIIKDVLSNQIKNKITLIYASRSPGKTIFKSQIDKLTKEYPEYLKVKYFFSESSVPSFGKLNMIDLEEILKNLIPDKPLVYVCAPEGITYMVWDVLQNLGFNPDDFRYESFTTKTLNIHKVKIPSVNSKVTYTDKKGSYDAKLDKDSTILEGLIEQKVPIEYSCMNGDCELCSCKVKIGEVVSLKGKQTKTHKAGESILPCVSYAAAEEIELEKN